MEGDANWSSEDSEKTKIEELKPPNKADEQIREKKLEKTDEEKQRVSACGENSSDCQAENSSRGESKASQQIETLTSVQPDFDESSHLSEVPVEYSLQPLQVAEELKDRVMGEVPLPSKVITSEPAKVEMQAHDELSNIERSPTSVTQSISSIASPMLQEQKVKPVKNGNNLCISVPGKQNSPRPKTLSLKSPSDGYNWRKYGQKQVKSPEGSRSYYRCTFSDCRAKKIECSGLSNHVVETVYKSPHNHDPPHRGTCTRETMHSPPITPANLSYCASHPEKRANNELVPLRLSEEQPVRGVDQKPEIQPDESCGSDETMEDDAKDERVGGPEYKKRQKYNSNCEVSSLSRPQKKSKFVVHAAEDEGISGDGFRWRKYGQKMVKGNPHPRNYYRCTSAGCPVRKHIERAVDNANSVVITYKGVHDHDTPVPKKRLSQKNALMVSTSSVSVDN